MRFTSALLTFSATALALPIYEHSSPLSTIETIPAGLTEAHALSERATPGLPTELSISERDEYGPVEEALELKNGLPVGVKRDDYELVSELEEAKDHLRAGSKRQANENIVTDLLDGKKHAAWKRTPGCPTSSGTCLWKKAPCTGSSSKYCLWRRIVPVGGTTLPVTSSTSKFHDMTS